MGSIVLEFTVNMANKSPLEENYPPMENYPRQMPHILSGNKSYIGQKFCGQKLIHRAGVSGYATGSRG
jgi:hypothetical protein